MNNFEVLAAPKQNRRAQAKIQQVNEVLSSGAEIGELGEVTPPRLRQSFPIQYPESAKRAGQDGQVIATLSINEFGQVRNVEIKSASSQEFVPAALEGLRQYLFFPASQNGKAIAVQIKYVYQFQLQGN